MRSTYFEDVERGLRAAARHQAHLPWYLRLGRGHRRVLIVAFAAVVVAGPSLAAAGVFESGLQIISSSCSASGSTGSASSHSSCTFVLSDGRRFLCAQGFALSHPTVGDIFHSRTCTSLPSSRPAASAPPVLAGIVAARQCLLEDGLKVHGGAVPTPSANAGKSPAGELIVANHRTGAITAFVGFYANARQAQQREPYVARNAKRLGGQVQRLGAVTVLWLRAPAPQLRSQLVRCVS